MSNVTIRNIKTIFTEPDGIRLVIVKIETSEPGLSGVGCATFTQRPTAVKVAIDDYLRPFLIGKGVDDIEDIWQTSYISSYWRNGPVLNNALSGVDQALWDIKAKWPTCPFTTCSVVRHGRLQRCTYTQRVPKTPRWRMRYAALCQRDFTTSGYRSKHQEDFQPTVPVGEARQILRLALLGQKKGPDG